MRTYSDPSREAETYALPDVEVFYIEPDHWTFGSDPDDCGDEQPMFSEPGYYYWFCFPECIPDSDPVGPFATEAEAIADAQNQD